MTQRKSITRDLGRVLAGDLGTQLVGIVRGLAVPLLMSPVQYGLWRVILLVWQYGIYLHLGSFALLNRELPGLLAAKAHGRMADMRQTAFWGTMVVTSLVAIGLIGFSLTPAAGTEGEQLWALRISGFGLLAEQIYLYVAVDFRVHSQFGTMSLLGFVKAGLALLLMIPLAYVAGVPGLAAGMALASALAAAAFGRRTAFDPPTIRPRAFFQQALEGIPLSSVPFLTTAIASAGQIVAAAVLGLEAAGFYGLGAMIGTVVYAMPRALGLVLYPRYLASYATDADPAEIGGLLRRSLRVTSVLSTVAVCGAAILLEPLYHFVFPQYLPALGASYSLTAMMPFLACALVLQNALLALRLHAKVITLQVGAVTLSAGLALAGAYTMGDVAWVALGVMVAHVTYGIATMWLALAATPTKGRGPFLETLAQLPPIVLMGGLTIAMVASFEPSEELGSRLLVPLLQLLALGPLAAFFMIRTWRTIRPEGR